MMRNTLDTVRVGCDACVRALAVFAGLNLLMGLASPTWNGTWLWIQGGGLPGWMVTALVAAFCVAVLVAPRLGHGGVLLGRAAAVVLAAACLADALTFYRLRAVGRLHEAAPVPLSLLLALLLLAWVATAGARPRRADGRTRRALWLRVVDRTAPLWLIGVGTLLHILFVGASDYRRPADAAVVFGAAVRADGRPSRALLDRTTSACALYHAGLVRTLVLSGGRDPRAPLSEPECMARIATSRGVPSAALVLDESGRNSAASVRAGRALAKERGWKRLLMVSHDYHLSRIQLLCRRAGLDACTVPATESAAWLGKPLFVLREVLAWGWAFVRPDLAA